MQDIPIDRTAYGRITELIGDQEMPGLLVHVVIEQADGTLRYLDAWESKEAHDAAFETVVHPAVHRVLREVGFDELPPEPPRHRAHRA